MKKSWWQKPFALHHNLINDYMERWIFKHPLGTFRIHKIMRSDNQRHMHDHPFSFFSIILKSGYWDVHPAPDDPTKETASWHGAISTNFKRAEECHRLVLAHPVWTFVITGRYRRDWGFHTSEGWISHDQYNGEA